jgi:hypothetical protein
MLLASAAQVDDDRDVDLWTVLWIGIAIVVIGILVLVLVTARRPSAKDLGSVSSQWIVEHRASQPERTIR